MGWSATGSWADASASIRERPTKWRPMGFSIRGNDCCSIPLTEIRMMISEARHPHEQKCKCWFAGMFLFSFPTLPYVEGVAPLRLHFVIWQLLRAYVLMQLLFHASLICWRQSLVGSCPSIFSAVKGREFSSSAFVGGSHAATSHQISIIVDLYVGISDATTFDRCDPDREMISAERGRFISLPLSSPANVGYENRIEIMP